MSYYFMTGDQKHKYLSSSGFSEQKRLANVDYCSLLRINFPAQFVQMSQEFRKSDLNFNLIKSDYFLKVRRRKFTISWLIRKYRLPSEDGLVFKYILLAELWHGPWLSNDDSVFGYCQESHQHLILTSISISTIYII